MTEIPLLNDLENEIRVLERSKNSPELTLSKRFLGMGGTTRSALDQINSYLDGLSEDGDILPTRLNDVFRSLDDTINSFDFGMLLAYALFPGILDEEDEELEEIALETVREFGKISANSVLADIDNFETLQDNFEVWKSAVNRDLNAEIIRDRKLLNALRLLSEHLGQLSVSNFFETGFLAEGTVLLDGRVVLPTEGPQLLDLLKVSFTIPYAVFDPPTEEFQKIYKVYSSVGQSHLDFTALSEPTKKEKNEELGNTLTMMVWVGNDPDKTSINSYIRVQINLTRGTFEILTTLKDRETWTIFFERFSQAFGPRVQIENIHQSSTSGYFNIYDVQFNLPIFIDRLLRSPTFSSLIRFKEGKTPVLLKADGQVGFDFVELALKPVLRFRVKTNRVDAPSPFPVADHSTGLATQFQREETLERETPYMVITVDSAHSPETIQRFIQILAALMIVYETEAEEIADRYAAYMGDDLDYLLNDSNTTSEKPTTAKKVKKPTNRKISKLSMLQSQAPEIVKKGSRFATDCEAKKQPILISRERAEEIEDESLTFTRDGAEYPVQVLKFPIEVEGQDFSDTSIYPERYFICAAPGDVMGAGSYPYPGVVDASKWTEGMNIYSVAPCCFKDDQEAKRGSNLNKYRSTGQARIKASTSKTQSYVSKTDKIRDMEAEGMLRPEISDLLVTGAGNVGTKFTRLGVANSRTDNNALLHCVLRAVGDPEYLDIQTAAERIEYVRRIRSLVLPSQVYPECMKQELWDFSNEEIMEMLGDNDIYLDSQLFYRALEEAFNINLFVFQIPTKLKGQQIVSQKPELEIPRAKYFHARTFRNRHCIVVARHSGTEADNRKNDHYELIIQSSKSGSPEVIFDARMNLILNKAMLMTLQNVEWSFEQDQLHARILTGKFSPNEIFNRLDGEFSGQILDSVGKLRGVQINDFQVFIPPCQPLNQVATPILSDPKVTLSQTRSIFGEPYSVDRNQGVVYGLWYPLLDLKEGMFIPIIPEKSSIGRNGSPNPLLSQGKNETARITKLLETRKLLTRILTFVYFLFPDSYPLDQQRREDSVRTFFEKRVTVGNEPDVDTAEIYNLSRVPEQLPDSLPETMDVLERTTNLVRDGKIYLFSDLFAREIEFMLNRQGPQVFSPIMRLRYERESDFKSMQFVRILFGENNFELWNNSRIEIPKDIRTVIKEEDWKNEYPFLIQVENRIFLLQNVSSRNILEAQTVAEIWRTENRNLGYKPSEEIEELVPYVLYQTNPVGEIVPVEDRSAKDPDFLEIFQYSNGRLAAMLPML